MTALLGLFLKFSAFSLIAFGGGKGMMRKAGRGR